MTGIYKTTALAISLLAIGAGCSQAKYAYHTVYKLNGCGQVISRDKLAEGLMRGNYLRASERQGPYDIYHRAAIEQKGPLAAEKYEDKAGDIAVAVCPGSSEQYVLVEEWKSCKDRKDCTKDNQRDIRGLVEKWGCQVSERSGHSKSWKLEDRQDWTQESCSFIATNLTF